MEYSEKFKAALVRRMAGPRAVSASALEAEVGVPQPTLSRWLREAGSVGGMADESGKASAKTRGRKTWMGHKRIDETMLCVNFAGAHMRPIPPAVLLAPGTEVDPDQRILRMLGARGTVVAQPTATKSEAEEVRVVS